MLSATKHLGPANEILRFAQDDEWGQDDTGRQLRLMHIGADNALSKLHVDYRRSQSSVQAGFIIGIHF